MNITSTGIYKNKNKQQWEAWAMNLKTEERHLLGACSFVAGKRGREIWEKEVWSNFIRRLLPMQNETIPNTGERIGIP